MKKIGETYWFTGLSGSGKTTLGDEMVKYFEAKGDNVYLLDGDVLRIGLNNNLGFSDDDRFENIRRACMVT